MSTFASGAVSYRSSASSRVAHFTGVGAKLYLSDAFGLRMRCIIGVHASFSGRALGVKCSDPIIGVFRVRPNPVEERLAL